MQDSATETNQKPDIQAFLEKASAVELARRSLLGASVFVVISLIMLMRTPVLLEFGWWNIAEAPFLIVLGAVRVWFALGFEKTI